MRIKMNKVVQVLKCGAKIAVAAAAVVLAVGVMKGTAYADDTTAASSSSDAASESGSDETASKAPTEAQIEGGIKWYYSSDGKTLTIEPVGESESVETGSTCEKGEMKSYSAYPTQGGTTGAPAWGGTNGAWFKNVANIVIADGVTNITSYAFGVDESSEAMTLESVTIGKDVKKIQSHAFYNAHINKLTFNGTAFSNAGDISYTAFTVKKSTDSSAAILNVGSVYCSGVVEDYFELFTGDTQMHTDDGVVDASSVDINPFDTLKFVDRNVLDSGKGAGDVQYKRGNSGWKDATIESASNAVLAGFLGVYDALENANYDIDSRLKIFDISRSDGNTSARGVQVRLPVPSVWKEHADSIQIIAFSTDGTFSTVDSDDVTIEDGYITFTPPHFSAYALYYSYEAGSDSSGGSDESGGQTDTDGSEVTVEIDANYFNYYAYQVGTNSADIKVAGTDEDSAKAVTDAFAQFYAANQTNNSGYKIDDDHLKAFNVTAKVNGVEQTTKIDSLSIWVAVPAAWADKVDKLLILTVTDGKIEVVQKLDVRSNNGSVELRFVPPHFSPYAIYYADAETTTTTVAATTTTATTKATTAATTKATTTASSTTTKAVSGGSNTSGGSGKLDSTPGTGVKDFMWIAVPIAVMLMGVGVVVLAMRKKKSLDE